MNPLKHDPENGGTKNEAFFASLLTVTDCALGSLPTHIAQKKTSGT